MTSSLRWLKQSAFLHYGGSLLSVVFALAIAQWLRAEYGFGPLTPFLCAIMFSAWLGGAKPGLIAVALSLLVFYYYFVRNTSPPAVDANMPRLLFAAVTALFIVALSDAQRNATLKLRESDNRFRQIAENLHQVVWLATADQGKILYVSPAYEAIWGRSCESLYRSPRSFMAPIHPEDRPSADEAIARQRGHGFQVEYRVVRPDGSIRWIWDRGFPITDENGHVFRVAGIAEDITERKQAADAAKQTEDRIRLIIDTIPVMAWSLRPDGVVDFLNQRWIDYAGLSLEEYVKDPQGPIHPDDAARVFDTWRRNMAAGAAYEEEMRLRRADGIFRWFLVRTAPLRDEKASIIKWFGSSVDIEDRKQSEEALKRAENNLRVVLDATPAMIHTARPDGYLDYFNQRWLEFVGLPLEKLEGWAWMACIHADDVAGEEKLWRACIASGEPFECEVRTRRADGKYRWMLHRKVAVRDGNGNIVKWYGSGTDIDDRKRAEDELRRSEQQLREREELYRLLAENTTDLVRVHNPDGRSIYGSPSVERLYGRQPTTLDEFGHPEDAESLRQWWTRVLAGNGENFIWRVRDRNGASHWLESRAAIVQYRGQPRVMTVCRDVTRRKEAEDALRHSEQQLHSLVRRLHTAREDEAKRIARELHDDLGQKLTALNMEITDLEAKLGETAPRQRAQIARMHTTVDRMIEVVQELSSELRLGQLDVLGLTAAIEWQLKEFATRSKIPCKVTRLDEISHLSDAQSTAVFRILQEALTNIVRHAGATQVDVSLQAAPDRVLLKIHDNGRGITAAELSDRKAIGLLGMRERAEGVGGTVTFTGERGKGTTVLVTIPINGKGRITA